MDQRIIGTKTATTALLVLLAVTIFSAWMSVGAYQSHYVSALRTLGDSATNSIIGEPKDGRGDEWSTYLPMFKQAYHEGFPEFSKLEPYHERLDWFIAIPHANLSLLFLPNQITYWFLPGAKALSFQGFYYNALFLGSAFWLLVNLGVKPRFAALVPFAMLFNQFYQMWWTSNFPSLGASLLPFAVLSSRIRPLYKFPLLFWAIGHMIFGEMYPPSYISLAVAVLPFMLAARPDLVSPKQMGFAAIAAIAALGAYLLVNWDFFNLVSGTSYPGHRINVGGDSSIRALAALIFPTFPLQAAKGSVDALYEFNMAGTFLPLMLIAVLPWAKWDAVLIRVSIITALVATTLICYMLIGFPRPLAEITGFYLVPARRMHLGLSILITCYSALVISRNFDRLKVFPLFIVAACYALFSVWVGTSADLASDFFGIQFYPYIPVALLLVALPVSVLPLWNRERRTIVIAIFAGGMTLAHIVIFGSFNPIMRASDIISPVDTQVTRDWKALYAKNGGRPFAIEGNYGHLLRGEGLAALEAIHLANVSPKIYSKVFPGMSDRQIDDLFNRFRGIAFANIPKMDASTASVVFPLRKFGVSFEHSVSYGGGSDPLSIGDVSTKVVRRDATSFDVYWGSSLSHPLAMDAPLLLSFDCRVRDSWLTRYPVVIAGERPTPVALQGLAGTVNVIASSEQVASQCVSRLRISSPSNMIGLGESEKTQSTILVPDRYKVAEPVSFEAGRHAAVKTGISSGSHSQGEIIIASSTPFPGECSFDSVDGSFLQGHRKLTRDVLHSFKGWLVDGARAPVRKFSLILKGVTSFKIDATTGVSRPDVASYFQNPASKDSGFGFSVSLEAVPVGEYRVLFSIARDAHFYYCDSAKSLRIE